MLYLENMLTKNKQNTYWTGGVMGTWVPIPIVK
jgi:hypothetical protein